MQFRLSGGLWKNIIMSKKSLYFFQIYNGMNDNYQQLAHLCNQKKKHTIITSTGNFMFIRFSADYSIQKHGFMANFSSTITSKYHIITNSIYISKIVFQFSSSTNEIRLEYLLTHEICYQCILKLLPYSILDYKKYLPQKMLWIKDWNRSDILFWISVEANTFLIVMYVLK